MEYSIGELARLAGVSTRTLRWYGEKGLLKPCRTDRVGVRYYSAAEVDRLQQIMFYRALGFDLLRIKECLDDPERDRVSFLREQLCALEREKAKIEGLIEAVKENIDYEERNIVMSDKRKFEAFKRDLIAENESRYGREAREKYGDGAVDAANAAMMGLSEEEYAAWDRLGREILDGLETSVRDGLSPASEAGKEIARKHAEWIRISTGKYTREMHRGIAQMYVLDERFTAYYDKNVAGCAQFLRDAVIEWI